MAELDAQIVIRMGSHSEKEYVEKLIHLFDGVSIGANLIEATPGATASLLVRISGKKNQIPFYFDPMTYAYGSYVDPHTGKVRNDLDWIKSDQKKNGQPLRDFKSSYRKLADKLGPPFDTALARELAITPNDFATRDVLRKTCQRVASYQLTRLRDEFASDPDFAQFADLVPEPQVVFAPYFYIEPSRDSNWLNLTMRMATETARLGHGPPTHMVLCAPDHYLANREFLSTIASEIPKTGVAGVWLWFSRFDEYTADAGELNALRRLVEELSKSVKVFNMHGGFFSLALSKFGLSGISHGVGYGEQKDVVPVIGQSTPTVRYYLPTLRRRLSVPEIELCFRRLGIKTPRDFYASICAICKGIITKDLAQFAEFGERHFSSPNSKRLAQTPAAAKRCRFHFLLNRHQERTWVRGADINGILARLRSAAARWRLTTLGPQAQRLLIWESVLR
jgi:hypothetical protein